MKKSLALTLALIFSAVLAAPAVSAQEPGADAQAPRRRGFRAQGEGANRPHFRRGPRAFAPFGQLDLTDVQREQMKQIRENYRESLAALSNQIRAKRQELHQSFEGGAFNEAAAAQKLAEIAPLEARLMAERHKMMQEELSVLTAEQRAKLEQMREQLKNRRSERLFERGFRSNRRLL